MLDTLWYRTTYFLREAFQGIKNNRFTHGVAMGTITFSLLIFSGFLLTVINSNRILEVWQKKIHLIAYLAEGATEKEIEQVGEKIASLPAVLHLTYVSKEQALARLRQNLQGQNGILEHLDENPLPSSFEIQLKDNYKNPEHIAKVALEIAQIDAISDVEYGKEWLEKFSAFTSLITTLGIALGFFLLLATVLIICNTLRLTIYSRGEEIEIMKLVGATNLFIQIPFFLEGILQGLTGALLALGVLYLGYKTLVLSTIAQYSIYLGTFTPVFLPRPAILGVIMLGILLGIVGCALSMGRFLKV